MYSIPFSVLMCVYKNDKSSYFKIALESVLNQSVTPSEIILVIDGPVPKETREIINEFALKYKDIFNFIDLKVNVGHGKAKNIGLEKCTYE
jgi:glycosyltransferase involved in cell wall biosynthesis